MQFHIKTYGCQMNERDSGSVSALLESRGFTAAASEAEADLVIVNTCSVRGKAEQKALGKLGLLVAAKRDRPDTLVGAMGCMVQRMGDKLFTKVPGLDFAVGTQRLARLPSIVDLVRSGEGPVLDVDEEPFAREDLSVHGNEGPAAFVNVLFGCDRGCAYCVVPSVRGSEWSRPGESVAREVEALVRSGARDVTLLGQSVMSYGRRTPVWPDDHVSPLGFSEPLPRLLEAVGAVPGLARLRFTSGHPSGCTPELVRAMAEVPAVCEHLHLPSQSGSDRVLGMMRRGYTSGDYRAAVTALRSAVPGLALTTDIIVGFPTEAEEDFELTRRFMDEIGFDNAFIFKYSPRPGTLAAEWEDDVADDEKVRRNRVLLEDQEGRCLAINERLTGRRLEVLVVGDSARNAERSAGRTRTNKIVVFDPHPSAAAGELVDVDIDRAMPQTLYGRVVPPEADG